MEKLQNPGNINGNYSGGTGQIFREDSDVNRYRNIEQLPRWYDRYLYITKNYRWNYTVLQATKSLFEWHNETVNVWTEMIPCFMYLVLQLYLTKTYPYWSVFNAYDYKTAFISFSGYICTIRAFISGMAHNYHFVNAKWSHWWWIFDVLSINWTLSYFAMCYIVLIFYCKDLRIFASIILCYAVFAITVSHAITIQDLEHIYYMRSMATALAFLFSIFWFFLVVIANHLSNVNSHNDELFGDGILYTLFGIGTITWVIANKAHSIRWPERWVNNSKKKETGFISKFSRCVCAGRVNNLGTSHQIWHVLINVGTFCAIGNLFLFVENRVKHDTCT